MSPCNRNTKAKGWRIHMNLPSKPVAATKLDTQKAKV